MFQEFPDDNRNDDFLNEFRQKISTQDTSAFEEKRNEMKRSKSVFIGAVSGVALAGIVGWFVLSPQYAQNTNVEIPVIRKPQTAIKVQPSEPGGMEILNQDKSVYDIIEKKSGGEPVVENLLPPPEAPKMPVIQAQQQPLVSEFEIPAPLPAPAPAVQDNPTIDKIIAEAQKDEVINEAKQIVEVKEAVAVKEEPAEKVVSIAEISKEVVAEAPKPEPVKEAKAEPVKKSEPAPVKEVKQETPKEAPKPAVVLKDIPVGSWQVQLMSSQNKAAVNKSWESLSKKYGVLKNQPHEIEEADLGFDGIFYRLKAGAFRDRAGADSLCKDIKALGGSCIVKKK